MSEWTGGVGGSTRHAEYSAQYEVEEHDELVVVVMPKKRAIELYCLLGKQRGADGEQICAGLWSKMKAGLSLENSARMVESKFSVVSGNTSWEIKREPK